MWGLQMLPSGVPDGCLAGIKGSATTVGTLHQAKCWLDYPFLKCSCFLMGCGVNRLIMCL